MGGTESDFGEWPWQVSLGKKSDGKILEALELFNDYTKSINFQKIAMKLKSNMHLTIMTYLVCMRKLMRPLATRNTFCPRIRNMLCGFMVDYGVLAKLKTKEQINTSITIQQLASHLLTLRNVAILSMLPTESVTMKPTLKIVLGMEEIAV